MYKIVMFVGKKLLYCIQKLYNSVQYSWFSLELLEISCIQFYTLFTTNDFFYLTVIVEKIMKLSVQIYYFFMWKKGGEGENQKIKSENISNRQQSMHL